MAGMVPAVDVHETDRRGNHNVVVGVAKTCLWLASWVVAVGWLVLWFKSPTTGGRAFKSDVAKRVGQSTFFGKSATNYVLYTGPVIALAILALLYLELDQRYPHKRRCSTSGKHSLALKVVRLYRAMWTQPLVVKSPMGILSFVDHLGIAVVLLCVVWLWAKLLIPQFDTIDAALPLPGLEKWQMKIDKASATLGGVIPFTVALLFLPVTRGSPILRLIDVPFEQAVRYHRWIGHLTMLLVTVHGGTFAIFAGSKHQIHLLGEWKYAGISNAAGVIAAVAGITMWISSLPCVRAGFFNFFYALHHLYVIFFAFYAFHVDWNHMGSVMGPIFLFFIDRFLRLVQSRRQVTGVAARVLPSGVVELKIPKHSGFRYSALSYLYINIPGVSRLEWHPFSATSSPLDSSNELTVCIKPLGDWTRSLHTAVSAKPTTTNSTLSCPFGVTLRAEGPYGHESNYYLRYKSLILVAGGIGVTPYLAILRDLLERHALQQQDLPTKVRLIWCVRRSSELATLRGIRPAQIYPNVDALDEPKRLTLDVQAYVTGEQPATQSNATAPSTTKPLQVRDVFDRSPPDAASSRVDDDAAERDVVVDQLAAIAANENLWVLAVILASTTGFVLMSGLFRTYVVAPTDDPMAGHPFSTALETFLFLVSVFVGIVLCGGAVVLFWIVPRKTVAAADRSVGTWSSGRDLQDLKMQHCADLELNEDHATLLEKCVVVAEGARPKFQELFAVEAAKNDSGGEVGVLVCGPRALQESVAAGCRSQNLVSSRTTQFHFHSVSFAL